MIKMSQRLECGSLATFSHFKMAQKTMAVKNDEKPYTSASTAENQNESEKVYANPPTKPLPKIAMVWLSVGTLSLVITLLVRWVMVQNRNKMVNALARTVNVFISTAASSGPPNKVKKRPSNM